MLVFHGRRQFHGRTHGHEIMNRVGLFVWCVINTVLKFYGPYQNGKNINVGKNSNAIDWLM